MSGINLDGVRLVGLARPHVQNEVIHALSPWGFNSDQIVEWASTDENVLLALHRLKSNQLGGVTSILVQGLKAFEDAYGTQFGYAFSIAEAVNRSGISIPTIHLGQENAECTFAGHYHLGWENTLESLNTPFAQLLMNLASQQSGGQVTG